MMPNSSKLFGFRLLSTTGDDGSRISAKVSGGESPASSRVSAKVSGGEIK